MNHPYPKSRRSPCRPAWRQAQRGSTLIEVLVAALILSIGIMALVGVQGSSAQMAKMAQQRGDAARLAQDLADRIRANGDASAVNDVYAKTPAYNGNPQAQNIPATCKGNTDCTTAQIATLDLAEMQEQARLLLPNGAFFVSGQGMTAPAGTPKVVDVWVIWQTASTRSDATGTLTGLNCPAAAVSGSIPNVQCLLTRVML
jgi:type IV pilus assembly protein PilV